MDETDLLNGADFHVAQAMAWSVAAELHRRHPSEVVVGVGYYPSGNPMVEVRSLGQGGTLAFNLGASLHKNSGRPGRFPDRHIWQRILHGGVPATVRRLEEVLELPNVDKPQPSTGSTLVTRAISRFLSAYAFSGFEWVVLDVYEEGYLATGQIVDAANEAGLVAAADNPVSLVVKNHRSEVVAFLSGRGVAVSHDGHLVDLLDRYRSSGRSVDKLVREVFGSY